MDKDKGLYQKYRVLKEEDIQKQDPDTRYCLEAFEKPGDMKFVLSPEKDIMSRQALRTYASWCLIEGYDQLADDLIGLVEGLDETHPLESTWEGQDDNAN